MADSDDCRMITDTDRQDNPVIYLQCDWNESLRNIKGEAWISCKYRGERSFHGKIQSKGITREGIPSVTVSEGFTVKVLSRIAIYVKHLNSGHSCIFEAPRSTFTGIHKKSVVSLDATSGGLGVSVCTDNSLLIWDSKQGLTRRTLTAHVGDVYRCRFFPSGLVILSGGVDMQLRIWSAETGRCAATLSGHTASITDFAFVDRGRNIISVSKDGKAKLWDCGESRCLGNLVETGSPINCCSISSVNNHMQLGEPQEPPSDREVGTEGKVLLIGCESGTICCVAVRSRQLLFSLVLTSAVNCITFMNENQFAVGTQDGQIRCYNIQEPTKPCISWFESNSAVLCLVPYKNKGLFVGRADGLCTYYQLDKSAARTRIQLTGPDCDPVYDISFDDTYIFTACRDTSIRKYAVAKMLMNLVTDLPI